MLQKLLRRVINDFLGQFLQQIDQNKLSVSLWSGSVELKNVKLKHELFQNIGLPYDVKFSNIGKVKITIPWKKLFTAPCVIQIHEIYILVGFSNRSYPANDDPSIIIKNLQKQIQEIGKKLAQKPQLANQGKQQSSYFDSMYLKMFDNLYLSIKNIEFILEDQKMNEYQGMIFGLSLSELQLYAVDKDEKKVFIDREKLNKEEELVYRRFEMKNLEVYENHFESYSLKVPKRNANHLLILNFNGIIEESLQTDQKKYTIDIRINPIKVNINEFVLSSIVHIFHRTQKIIEECSWELQQMLRPKVEEKLELLDRLCLEQLSRNKVKNKLSYIQKQKLAQIVRQYDPNAIKEYLQRNAILNMDIKDIKVASLQMLTKNFKKTIEEQIKKKQKELSTSIFHVSINLPEISIYYLNEVSQSILEISFADVRLAGKVDSKESLINFTVQKAEGFGLGRKTLIWVHDSDSTFVEANIIIGANLTSISGLIGKVSVFYDLKTIYQLEKIKNIAIDPQLKHKTIDSLTKIQEQIEKQFAKRLHELKAKISLIELKVRVEIDSQEWVLGLGNVQAQYSNERNILRVENIQLQQTEQYLTNSFSLSCELGENNLSLKLSPIELELNRKNYVCIHNLNKALFTLRKVELMRKSKKAGEVFLKQKVWKKCEAALIRDKLYLWQKGKQYPLAKVRVRTLHLKKEKNYTAILVGNLVKQYKIVLKAQIDHDSWLKSLRSVADSLEQIISEEEQSSKSTTSTNLQLFLPSFTLTISHMYFYTLHVENIRINNKVDRSEFEVQSIELKCDNNVIFKQAQTPLLAGQYSNNKTIAKVNQFSLTYKPEQVIVISSFLHLEDGGTQYDPDMLVSNGDSYVLDTIQIESSRIHIEGWNKKAKCKQLSLDTTSLKLAIQQFNNKMELQCKLQDVQLWEETNYSEGEGHKLIAQASSIQSAYKQMYGVLGEEKYGNKYLHLQVSHIQLTYIHQLILRTVDWISVQVLGVLTTPQYFDEYGGESIVVGYSQYKETKTHDLKQKMIEMVSKQQLYRMIFKQQPPNIKVNLSNISIIIPTQVCVEGGESMRVEGKSVDVRSKQEHKWQQAIKNNIITDVFDIYVSGVSVQAANKVITEGFNLQTEVKMFTKQQQYLHLFPKASIKFPPSICVVLLPSPTEITFLPISLQHTMLIINNNILYSSPISSLYIYQPYLPTPSLSLSLCIEYLGVNIVMGERQFHTQVGNLLLDQQRNGENTSLTLKCTVLQSFLGDEQVITTKQNFRKSSLRQTINLRSALVEIQHCAVIYHRHQSTASTTQQIQLNDWMILFSAGLCSFIVQVKDSLGEKNKYAQSKAHSKSTGQIKVVSGKKQFLSVSSLPVITTEMEFHDKLVLNQVQVCLFLPEQEQYLILKSGITAVRGDRTSIQAKDVEIVSSDEVEKQQSRQKTLLKPVQIKLQGKDGEWKCQCSELFIHLTVNDVYSFLTLAKMIKSWQWGSNQVDDADGNWECMMGRTQIMLTDSYFSPVLLGRLHPQLLSSRQEINTSIMIDYFNKRINSYQPLVQKTQLSIKYHPHLEINLHQQQTKHKEFLNINLSTNLLQSLVPLLSSTQKGCSSKHEGYVNGWVLLNELGQTIQCVIGEECIVVAGGQTHLLPVPINQPSTTKVYMSVRVGDKVKVKRLNINESGIKKYMFEYEGSTCAIYKELVVDIGRNVKFVRLYTGALVHNQTDHCLQLQCQNNNFTVEQSSTLYFPFPCQHPSISMNQQPLHSHPTIKMNNQLYLLQQKDNKMRREYTISPPCMVINKLPFSVSIACKKQHSNSIVCAQTIKGGMSDYLYTMIDNVEVSVHVDIDTFQWTEFIPVKQKQLVKVVNFIRNQLEFKLYKHREGMKDLLVFLPQMVLKNESNYDFYVMDKLTTSAFLLPSGNKACISHSRNLYLHLPNNNPTKLNLHPECTQFRMPLPLQQCSSKYSTFNYMEQFVLLSSSIQLGQFRYREFKLHGKYTIMNDTEHTILLRSADSTFHNTRWLSPGSKGGFPFLTTDFQTKQTYRITVEQPVNYEWSGQLSILKKGQYHFMLRNRGDNSKVLHFVWMVRAVGKYRYEIVIKSIQYVPIIIRNKLLSHVLIIPTHNMKIGEKQELELNWDCPHESQELLVQIEERENKNRSQYRLKVQKWKEYEQVYLKKDHKNIVVHGRQEEQSVVFQFGELVEESVALHKTSPSNHLNIALPLRIALINNSSSPVMHLCDICTMVEGNVLSSELTLSLNNVQIDNQTSSRVYYPVVFKTSLQLQMKEDKRGREVSLTANPIKLNIEEQFFNACYNTMMKVDEIVGKVSKQEQEQRNQQPLITKLKLPKLDIRLQIKTNKLSIQTNINLDQPTITKYPWQQIPYPIKDIAINVLSHLSISPWAFISSFQRGFSKLLNEEGTSPSFEGFFGQIIGAISNSISGMISVIVGNDIERVDDFLDGFSKGGKLFVRQLVSIKDDFQPSECSLGAITKGVGCGMVSMVFKPIKGLLRMTLKISEGIKKTALFAFEQHDFKTRSPIVFYGSQQQFTTYSTKQSQLFNRFIQIIGELKFFYLVKFYTIEHKLKKDQELLVMGVYQMVKLSLTKNQLHWRVSISEIQNIRIHGLCCIVIEGKDTESKQKWRVEINTHEQELALEIKQAASSLVEKSALEV